MAMQHFLTKAFERVVNLISLPATSKYQSYPRAGLTSPSIYEINQYGHGVIIGGGNLYENGELEANLDALQALEVPLMLFSLSAGRIYNRQHELVPRTDAMPTRIIQALHRRASYSLVRDRATASLLNGIGVANCIVGGCPTIFLDRIVSRLPELGMVDRSTVLISVRNPQLMSIPLKKQVHVFQDISRIIAFLRAEGHQDVRILCHDYRDIAFAASFPNIEYVYTGDVYTYLALLRSCALTVSYRLHSTLPCLSFGRPVIKISYDERAISLMETIGLGDWNIDMIRSDALMDEFIDRYRRLDELALVRAQARPTWDHLHNVMSEAFGCFAEDVLTYQQEVEDHLVAFTQGGNR
jgi:polysaccharide pyruvyl transferase WcaK-like protein